MTNTADRLTHLEIRSAEQAEQWKVIERLQKKVDALTERFLALEEQTAPGHEVTRPPHW